MTEQLTEPAKMDRLHALFALGRLSDELRSAVLQDREIISRFDLTATHPLALNEGIKLTQEELFDVLAKACLEPKVDVSISRDGSSGVASAWIEPDGDGVLEIENQRWRFKHARLLDPRLEIRLAALSAATAHLTLSENTTKELIRLTSEDAIAHDAFLDIVLLLETAPEHFRGKLEEKLAVRMIKLAEDDLLPTDVRYWNNLVPAIAQSVQLRGFVTNELRAEEQARVSIAKDKLFQWRSLFFGSSELVPMEYSTQWTSDEVLAAVEEVLSSGALFALAGAFEICVRRFQDDDRFVQLGDRVLQALAGDVDRLKRRSEVFATAFALTTWRLATQEETRVQPAFWRRLAGFGHAELVTQVFSKAQVSTEKLLDWALEQRWREFFLSVKWDMYSEPRWVPEWLSPDYLIADIFGRIRGALGNLDERELPKSWSSAIEGLHRWIVEKELVIQSMLPSILESGLPSKSSAVADNEIQAMMARDYGQLASEPSAENLVRIYQWVETIGVREEAIDDVYRAVLAIRATSPSLDASKVKTALSTATRIAVMSKNTKLAGAVVESLLYFSRNDLSIPMTNEVIFLLTECSAALVSRNESRSSLATSVENLAFLLPPGEQSGALAKTIAVLQLMDDELAALVGRARNTALLGAHAVKAAGSEVNVQSGE